MIPRIVHQMYFRDEPFSDLNNRCHETWRRLLPGWDIRMWTPHNLPKGIVSPWAKAALACGSRAAGSNFGAYVKYALLHKFGGVYFDNDIELLKPIETNHAYWLGWQRDGKDADINTSACACVPGHEFNLAVMREVQSRPINDHPLAFGPMLFTAILRERGLRGQGEEQMVGNIKVYSKEKWYPYFYDERADRNRVTPETFGIHHWEGTWK